MLNPCIHIPTDIPGNCYWCRLDGIQAIADPGPKRYSRPLVSCTGEIGDWAVSTPARMAWCSLLELSAPGLYFNCDVWSQTQAFLTHLLLDDDTCAHVLTHRYQGTSLTVRVRVRLACNAQLQGSCVLGYNNKRALPVRC